jgi:hypothetical protein
VTNTLAYHGMEFFTVAKKVDGSFKHSSLLQYGIIYDFKKQMEVSNTLAYYDTELFTTTKSEWKFQTI